MIGTEEEFKIRESQDFIEKYFVEYWYDYSRNEPPFAGEQVGKCKPIDLIHDGENWLGRNDKYEFCIYDSFEEALNHRHMDIDKLELVEEGLTEEQIIKFREYIKENSVSIEERE